MTDKEKIKAFKRLLKELGVYEAWVRNRKNHCVVCHTENFFFPVTSKSYLPDIINISFTWVTTDCEPLWSLLWDVTGGVHLEDINKVLSRKPYMKATKEQIKEEIEKYEQIKRIQR